jgi:hypothetical protein
MQFTYLVYYINTEAGAVPFGQLLSPFCSLPRNVRQLHLQ